MARKRSFFDDLATGLGEGLQIGAKIGQIRAQNRQQEQAAEIDRMKMAQKKFDDDYNHAYNASQLALQFANQTPMPGAKANLYSQVRTLMSPYMTTPFPDIPKESWNEVGDDGVKRALQIIKQKGVSRVDMKSQLEELSVELTGKLGAFKEQMLEEPTVESQRYGKLTEEEKRKEALVKGGLTPEWEITTGTIRNQTAKIAVNKETLETRVLTVGDQPVMGEEKELKPMPSESVGRFNVAVSFQSKMDAVIPLLFPDGQLDKQALIEAKTGTTPRGQMIRSAFQTMYDAIVRPRTGAALTDSEMIRLVRELDPSILFDDTDSAAFKINAALAESRNTLELLDPTKAYRNLIKQRQEESSNLTDVRSKNKQLAPEELADEILKGMKWPTKTE